MASTHTSKIALAATALFAAQAVFAVVHLAIGGEYAGFTHWPNDAIVDALLALAWISAGTAFAVYRRGLLALALIGCVASLSHGLAISLGARYVGLPFLVAAGLEFTALQRVFLTGVRPGAAGTL